MKLNNNFRLQKSAHRWCLHPLTLALCLVGLNTTSAWARDYFDPAFLADGDGDMSVDLSQYEVAGSIPEGIYLVDIYLNKQFIISREVRFSKDSQGNVLPELTPQELEKMGVNVQDIEALKSLPATQPVPDLSAAIPHSQVSFDLPTLRLDVSVPQVNLNERVINYVDPKLWDQGIPAALFNYTINGSKNWTHGQSGNADSSSQSLFATVNAGLNLGPWRLRSTVNYTASQNNNGWGNTTKTTDLRWNNTYLQRDIQSLGAFLTLGETSTEGEIFDGVSFRGAKLVSSTEMTPSNQRGFAPILSGIARTNARITVTQNGYIIYQTNVPPGPFRITDITQATSGGDLVMTVTEEDGSKQITTQAYSTLPLMMRLGDLKYEVSAGRFNSGAYASGSHSPVFLQGTVAYGLLNYLTLYGGVIGSSDYQSVALGSGFSLGDFGAMSVDVTGSKATLPGFDNSVTGAAYRARYSKSMLTSGTSIDLTTYRYATKNFYSFSEANTVGNQWRENWAPWMGERRRSSWQTSISQSLGKWGSIYLRGSRDDFWGSNRVINNVSAGFSSSIKNVSYSINYSENHTKDSSGNWPTNRQIALSFHVPLSLFSNAEMVRSINTNYTMTHDNSGRVSHQMGISGSLLNNKLSWSASQSRNNQRSGASGSLNLGFTGDNASFSMGYGYSPNSRSVNGSMMGGMLLHRHGVVFSSYLGDSVALISAPGVSGVKVSNGNDTTNRWGYGVAPFLQNYQRNVVTLDMGTLPDGVDIINGSAIVYPTKGAVVEAKFKTRVGRQAMLTIYYEDKPVAFGTIASLINAEEQNSSIVGDGGMVYLSGLPEKGELLVQWGRGADQQCQVSYDLGEKAAADGSINIAQQDVVCR